MSDIPNNTAFVPRLVNHATGTEPGKGEKIFRKYLQVCITHEASDIHIKGEAIPRIRVRGELRTAGKDEITKDQAHQICKDILDKR